MKHSGIWMVLALVTMGSGYWWGLNHASQTTTGVQSGDFAPGERKILYYRNPMGLTDISPVPKKDSMGMNYIPVYEENGRPAGQIEISADKIQKLGVRTEPATMRNLGKTVRAMGQFQVNERLLYTVTTKFDGYIENLLVNTTGQPVTRGQPLMQVYSPELVSAQDEYLLAWNSRQALKNGTGESLAGVDQLAQSALKRLRNWDISDTQLQRLRKDGKAMRTLTLYSPANGVVLEKIAVEGIRFMPGDPLLKIADLSSIWLLANVYEQDIALIQPGAKAVLKVSAYPDKDFTGTITYIYPTLNPATRTVPVRIELDNPEILLKPAMFAQVELSVGGKEQTLTVPDSAVIDSGTRRIVLVQVQEGLFESRVVKTGARSDNHIEIIEGVKAGEQVVVAANFLIDAESNLRAATGGLGDHAGHSNAQQHTLASTIQPNAVEHQTKGIVAHVDAAAKTISLNHDSVETLKWPAMTMQFKVANEKLLKDLKPGATIAFKFAERQPGEWVITAIRPIAQSTEIPNPDAGL